MSEAREFLGFMVSVSFFKKNINWLLNSISQPFITHAKESFIWQ
jgi:hypothetical protein